MSRILLILALLVTGTGCSATQNFLSTVSVTPPRVTFRKPPRLEATCNWTAVAVTYPPERVSPAPCAPVPTRPAENLTYFEEEETPGLFESSSTGQTATMFSHAPQEIASESDPIGIVHLKDEATPQSDDLSVAHVTPVPLGNASFIETAVAVTYPSGAPSPCMPYQVHSTESVAFFEEDEHADASSHNTRETSTETEDVDLSVNASSVDPPGIAYLDGQSIPPSVDQSVPSVTPVETGGTPIAQAALTTTPPTTLVRVESPSVLVQPDFAELLSEIRVQRKLIETLQRDLTRERSADMEAIEELEAAVEDLLVHSQVTHGEIPTTIGK